MPFDQQNEDEFPAFGLEDVVVISDGPEASSTTSASLHGATSDSEVVPPDGEAQTDGEPPEVVEPLPEFDPRYREKFEGLLFIGKLVRNFSWFGHRFRIRTLVMDELLEIGLLHRDYFNTLADISAYRTLVVAACLERVDDQPIAYPLGPDDTELADKFNFVRRSYYQITIDQIFEQYSILEGQMAEILVAVGEAVGQSEAIPG